MQNSDLYTDWDTYRYWKRLKWGSILLFIPSMMPITILSDLAFGMGFPAGMVMMGLWAGCGIFFNYQVEQFRCPGCRRRFFSKWLIYNPFTSRCLHCGLKKWTYPERETVKQLVKKTKQPN